MGGPKALVKSQRLVQIKLHSSKPTSTSDTREIIKPGTKRDPDLIDPESVLGGNYGSFVSGYFIRDCVSPYSARSNDTIPLKICKIALKIHKFTSIFDVKISAESLRILRLFPSV